MSNLFKISIATDLIPIITSILGFLKIKQQIIVQFNQPTYGNKIWIFLSPAILLFFSIICCFIVTKDRRKKAFSGLSIATPLEMSLAISNFLLVSVIFIILITQIINSR